MPVVLMANMPGVYVVPAVRQDSKVPTVKFAWVPTWISYSEACGTEVHWK